MSVGRIEEKATLEALLGRVWASLDLTAPPWRTFADAVAWAAWGDLQRLRWEGRAGSSQWGFWRLLKREQPFHPLARPTAGQAHDLVARSHRDDPRFWRHRAPSFEGRARVGAAMALLREAESELRRAARTLELAVCLELQGLLWRGSLDNGYEAEVCEAEAAELAEAGGWQVLAAVEQARGELWESWWQAATGAGWWRGKRAARSE